MDGARCRKPIGAGEVQALIARCRHRPVLPRPPRPETVEDLLSRIDRTGFVAEITCGDIARLGRRGPVFWKGVLALVIADRDGEALRVCWLDPARRSGFAARVGRDEAAGVGAAGLVE